MKTALFIFLMEKNPPKVHFIRVLQNLLYVEILSALVTYLLGSVVALLDSSSAVFDRMQDSTALWVRVWALE